MLYDNQRPYSNTLLFVGQQKSQEGVNGNEVTAESSSVKVREQLAEDPDSL